MGSLSAWPWFAIMMSIFAGRAVSSLTLGRVRCGQLVCEQNQYCSAEFNRCSPCQQICTADDHNFDLGLCEKNCQDYIHDMRFVQKTSQSQGNEYEISMLRDTVQRLQFQISVVLIISCVVLVLIVAISFVKCWKYTKSHSHKISRFWNRKKHEATQNSAKSFPTDLTHQNPHTESPKMAVKTEMKIDVPSANSRIVHASKHQPQPLNPCNLTNITDVTSTAVSIGDSSTPKTISTTLSHRYPAEDSTLDYSYDNMAMAKTPSPNVNPTNESKF